MAALPADAPQDHPSHQPVLVEELRALLPCAPGGLAVDATVGAGGHSALLITAVRPGGCVVGLDVDSAALSVARGRLAPQAAEAGVRLELLQANFRTLSSVLKPYGGALAVVADLGVSSLQLDCAERGFSFRYEAPLDLRMDPELPRTGAELLAELPEQELADLLYHLGGEHGARRIARRIVESRERGEPVRTTGQLERLVRTALKVRGRRRLHPATRTFQALRMAVNDEPGALAEFLEAAPEVLSPGGVLAVLSFHSGEDRMIKQAFKVRASSGRFSLVHRGVVAPSQAERKANPRSRSAKLRALKRL
jgi:16S rRNA (cytosine1402-N4)-methyltransferase